MDGKTKTRIFAAAVCMLAALTLTGCATSDAVSSGKDFDGILYALRCDLFGAEEQSCVEMSLNLPIRDGFTPVSSKSAYASIRDETMKEAYRDIEEAVFWISQERADNGCFELKYVRMKSSLAFDDIYIVKEAVLNDHPEVFWVLNNYTVRNNFHDGNYLVLYSKYSADEINSMFEEMNRAIVPIFTRIPNEADELSREMIVHDAIVDMVSYDYEAAESDDPSHVAFNVYGALVKNKAVCTGYAGAVKMLMNLLGIECHTVVGMSKNAGHMWNQIRINGDWYNLDATWDDSAAESDVLYSRYNYFNITDERLAINHKTGENYSKMVCEFTDEKVYVTSELYNFDLEECTATAANYYERNALFLTELNDTSVEKITKKFISTAQEGQEIIYLIFDSSVNSEEAETWMSKNNGLKSSALGRSLSSANKSGRIRKIKNCNLVRMYSDEDNVWSNLYAVRLVYA